MFRVLITPLALLSLVGCAGPTFADLGNGVAVPSQSIDEHAAANGLTRAQARMQMRRDSDDQRIADHAEKYGVSREEAEEQLGNAGR